MSVNDSRDEFKQLANEVFDISFNTDWGNAKLRATMTKNYKNKFTLRPLKTIQEYNSFENKI